MLLFRAKEDTTALNMLLFDSRIVVVDIGATQVACAAFAPGRDSRLLLEYFAVEALPVEPGIEARWIEDIARVLGRMAREPRLRGNVALAVPGHVALTKFIKTPAIKKSKRRQVIQFEATQAIPYPLDEVIWDHLLVADDGVDLEILLTAAKADSMLGLCATFSSVGYPVMSAVPSCVALHEAFRYNYPEIKDSALLVDVGGRSTQLVFMANGRFFGRTLPLGGTSVTQKIADELEIEFAAAERLKLELSSIESSPSSSSPSWRAVQNATEHFCGKVHAEITRSMVNVCRQNSGSAPTAVYLTGGGAQLEMLLQTLSGKLNLPVYRYASLRRVEVSAEAKTLGATESSHLFCQLVGLATRLVTKRCPAVDLLPSVVRNEFAFRRRQPVLIATAALILIGLFPPMQYFQDRAVAAHDDTVLIESQLEPLRERQKRNAEILTQIGLMKKSVAELQVVVAKKTNWLRFFKDLQARLVAVEDVWLESLSVVRAPAVKSTEPMQEATGLTDLRLVLSGRLLDRNNPISKVSPASYERVKALIASFGESEFIAEVAHERFDNSQPGILRFDFTLVVRPQEPL